MRPEDRYEELQALMQSFIPFDPYAKGRSSKQAVLARKLIALQMRQDGYPVVAISRAMRRHHSCIVEQTNDFLHILSLEDKNYLGYFEDVRIWKQFSQAVSDYDKGRTEPVYSRNSVISLGEFRRLTKDFPDDTPIKLTEGRSNGLEIRPSYSGNELLICSNK